IRARPEGSGEDNPSRGSENYLPNIVTWDRERIIRARPEGSGEDNPSRGGESYWKDHPSKTRRVRRG
ncbi:MAG TPA: hypothetical protein PLQ57_02370, partial [Saprospiraceae bacterium]|nr:hypothetical protein [Saprospiraceae bacterium]